MKKEQFLGQKNGGKEGNSTAQEAKYGALFSLPTQHGCYLVYCHQSGLGDAAWPLTLFSPYVCSSLPSAQVWMQSLNDTRTGKQIYFTTERGPGIPEMETHLLAGPWMRVLLKRDT